MNDKEFHHNIFAPSVAGAKSTKLLNNILQIFNFAKNGFKCRLMAIRMNLFIVSKTIFILIFTLYYFLTDFLFCI